MNMADPGAARAEATRSPSTTPADRIADPAAPRGCPYLLAEGGGWRLDLPSRDHRCAAFSPPAPLSPEKQARLCLTATHTSCATYLASLAARQSRLGLPTTDRATRWGLARTTTVIEDPGGIRARLSAVLLDRRRWPAIPAVLLVTTLFTLALSGFRAGGSVPAAASAGPSGPLATPIATSRPTARPSGTPVPEATTTPAPTTAPSPTAAASAAASPRPSPSFRTYRVRSGDTLSGIAGDFNRTPGAIAQLNGISLSSTLRVGQVLLIPN